MFELTDQPIDAAALRARMTRADAGACVVFEGWVRNHHAGQPVTQLEYEAFDELARIEGDAIVREAEQAHQGCSILCVHRTGSLPVGELAVWIAAASPHRHAAFLACRQVIEELKRRLPVWKKEHHPGGAAEWVNCTAESIAARLSPEHYFERQRSLPEVGDAGQAKLAQANVLIVGVGGLGCPAALYLAASGIGRLAIADGGRIEVSNLHRQILFAADDVGASKATVAAARLRAHQPHIELEILSTDLTAQNVRERVHGRTVVLDCTDNFATRFILHDACRSAGVPLVQGAVYRFEGELNLFHPHQGGCLHCLWSGRNPRALETSLTCAGGPVFAPAVGLIGVMQASETLKLILGLRGGLETTHTRLIDLMEGSISPIERVKDPGCPVCGVPATVNRSSSEPLPAGDTVILSAEEAAALDVVQWVALLEPGEILDSAAAPDRCAELKSDDLVGLREIAAEGKVLLACRRGIRSAALARLFRAEGARGFYALAGGLRAIRVGAVGPV